MTNAHLIVGIGLNVSNQKPTTCLNVVAHRLGWVAQPLEREDIVAAFFNKFESFYDIFISQGDYFSIINFFSRQIQFCFLGIGTDQREVRR